MSRVGVMLSGCGVEDGSEIFEAVLTLLALERGGASVVALAPDIEQQEVVNHYTGEEVRGESRSVLAESARLVRGKITSASEISAHELDALILVGGYGAVKNLSNYASAGDHATVDGDVSRLIREMHGLGKPIGSMCAASVVVAQVLGDQQPILTVGTDGPTSVSLMRFGAHHATTNVDQICVDDGHKLVSTAAFMSAHTVGEAEPGITKLVNEVLRLARENALSTAG